LTTIATTDEIIDEARNGRPFILVDADDRENEDIIVPGQFATPERINQMAIHARGLICLAITAQRAREPANHPRCRAIDRFPATGRRSPVVAQKRAKA